MKIFLRHLFVSSFFLFGAYGQAAVMKEQSVTIGHLTKTTYVFREHKVRNFKGYSLIKIENGTIKRAKVLSEKDYKAQLDNLDFVFSPKMKELTSKIQNCGDQVQLSQWKQGQKLESEIYCFTPVSTETKKTFQAWLWKNDKI